MALGLWCLVGFSKQSNNSLERGSKTEVEFPGFCIQAAKNTLLLSSFASKQLSLKSRKKMSLGSSNNIYIFLWLYCLYEFQCRSLFAHLQGVVTLQWGKYKEMLENTSRENCSWMSLVESRKQMTNKAFSQVSSPGTTEITACHLSGITGICLEG